MIQFHQISVGYGSRAVVKQVSFIAPRGQITSLIGPNGCGKTTLLKTACNLLRPSGGQVLFMERPVSQLSRRELAQLAALLPQTREIPAITVERLVAHGRYPHLSFGRQLTALDREKIAGAMEWTGVQDLAHRELQTLSGGERQRAYIALALAQDSEILLLDEPTTYLDIDQKYQVMDLVARLRDRGKTVLMVLHDLPLAFAYSDYIAVLGEGELKAFGPAEEVFQAGAAQAVFHVQGKKLSVDGREYYLFYNQRGED